MAIPLPQVHPAVDCASFDRTVLPFLSQLTTLPAQLQVAAATKDMDALKDIYLSTNPFISALGFTLVLWVLFTVLGEINRNYSQVDRFWSILPAVYNVHFVAWARMWGIKNQSLDTIALITLLWSIRLTFNYWRRGGYQIGSEDYRWEIVKSQMNNNRLLLFLFNATFISFLQPMLLLLVTASTYNFILLSRLPGFEPFGLPDLIFSRLAFFFLIIEFFADQQQWKFQSAKKEYQKTARIPDQYKGQFTPEDLERGFIVSGLWSLSRHPNYVAEQAIWLTLYLWNCYRTDSYIQWTGLGVLGYMLIFQSSTLLTESISAGKYPEYSEYQARVGRFIPRFSVKPRYTGSKKKAPRSETESAGAGEQATQEGKKSQ